MLWCGVVRCVVVCCGAAWCVRCGVLCCAVLCCYLVSVCLGLCLCVCPHVFVCLRVCLVCLCVSVCCVSVCLNLNGDVRTRTQGLHPHIPGRNGNSFAREAPKLKPDERTLTQDLPPSSVATVDHWGHLMCRHSSRNLPNSHARTHDARTHTYTHMHTCTHAHLHTYSHTKTHIHHPHIPRRNDNSFVGETPKPKQGWRTRIKASTLIFQEEMAIVSRGKRQNPNQDVRTLTQDFPPQYSERNNHILSKQT